MSTQPSLPFGALLRRFRLVARLTQEQLAERAGLSADAISTLERGVRQAPQQETIRRLATALALTPEERATFEAAARPVRAHPTALPLAASHSISITLPPLSGRLHELAALAQHLAGSGPPLLVLGGEPGIGKSRLLYEGVVRARKLGWTVLQGGCHRRSGQEPYAP